MNIEIWEDKPVLHLLKTHTYQQELTPLNKDRVYRRAQGFRWLSHKKIKVQNNGSQLLLVPQPSGRKQLVAEVHRDMGHFGAHRMLDRMRQNYWWKGMDATVAQVVKACMPCARTKAGFKVSGKELQPLKLQGIMFRWGFVFAGPLIET